MSHNAERSDKTCLNCQAHVVGRFCHVCGQENVETKESFWSLTKHFVYDILHFDGKFFNTLGAIFLRPGLVARRYAEGKRASYLHPIRMYLFTSAVFFLIFFSFEKITKDESAAAVELTPNDRIELAADLQKAAAKNSTDSLLRQTIEALQDTTHKLSLKSIGRIAEYTSSAGAHSGFAPLDQYDSVQNSLPRADRDNWMERRFKRLKYKLNPAYNGTKSLDTLKEMLLHRLPYMLFVSLPFFALLLRLLYIRRKSFYYSDHAVFTLFHYILSFILLLLIFGSSALRTAFGWRIFKYLNNLFLIAWFGYLFVEMKVFYGQGYLKTFAKFVLVSLLGFLLILFLFILFSLVTVFQL